MRAAVLAISILIGISSVALAETPREVAWEDLVPGTSPIKNPFADLSMDQRDDIAFIARTRANLLQGFITEDSAEAREAAFAENQLSAEGVQVSDLLAAAEELQGEIARRNAAVAPELNGAFVRIPGYALPLEFNEGGVKEFLLVPYVGACIHVPPPPPNQMVFVRLDAPYVVESMYSPVWITGRMHAEASTRNLSLVDGSSNIAVGYSLDGVSVEPYD